MAKPSGTSCPLGPTSESEPNNTGEGENGGDKEGGRARLRPRTFATGKLMSNLPYMGELTFDSRPRRGRKPKKADICHLISKNYGITFPLAYVNQPNSCLEGRGSVACSTATNSTESPSLISYKSPSMEEEGRDEPLNLCLRDRVPFSSDSNLVNNLATPTWIHESESRPHGRGRKRPKKPILEKVQIPSPILPPPPPSEVSICKFKFTGGAKPSLQEKKMLSVDAGGNFRFYTDKQGGGTKSLTSQGNSKATIPQILPISPPPAQDLIPIEQPSSPESSGSDDSDSSPSSEFKRKRRTRKSLMREKLEKTFKEKGFLIQTQQLESAEGATYCKFRQLRKFTRYLFRSWKDYLPENVQAISGGTRNDDSGPVPPEHAQEIDDELLP